MHIPTTPMTLSENKQDGFSCVFLKYCFFTSTCPQLRYLRTQLERNKYTALKSC